MRHAFCSSYEDGQAVSQVESAELFSRLPGWSEVLARVASWQAWAGHPLPRSQPVKFSALLLAGSVALSGMTPVFSAIVTYSLPSEPQYTTVPQAPPAPGQFANNGIWLTMTNGTPLVVSNNSFPGYVDGQFQLRTLSYATPAGEVLVQGFLANGNDVAVQGTGGFPSNPAYIPFGGTVGPASSFIGGASFTSMSGSFGNWISGTPLRGALGVTFPAGGNTHYGYIDVTQQTDGAITLHGYAYNSVPNAAITTAAVPEPALAGLFTALGLPLVAARLMRRRIVAA
jgi:hypothetical protein